MFSYNQQYTVELSLAFREGSRCVSSRRGGLVGPHLGEGTIKEFAYRDHSLVRTRPFLW